ncbi:ER-golgi trafficking TRAPP I complex 85 kDa subunit-domain-containing protein [Crepidotus variabilis]|uniref:ER-golgi trafficking TRAPP I complex 85 kDa subunit-domain-containing protein n=1 Tax=Crepidotus variabilis TaxID=179855 RepID=A0A9P6EF97_9AGAR|nr:ER-golgi trafficking TRAPP I complex 85 kDa subunit-domain-containing protein [Crepidotus variabilis]
MAPTIPTSLSPHIVVLTSPDLEHILKQASLPSLPHILQSFSPLPQVTTRTTSLSSIPHTSFALRFSEITQVEEACREDEDDRAGRMVDWMSERIGRRCAGWVEGVERDENSGGGSSSSSTRDAVRTPWWDELRRCVEGDYVPSRVEGWNHPMAVILAVSTSSPNPLQAITALHARNNHFPPWVDTNYLKYTLIIHTQDSPLSDEEATALYNAIKKQYGLHSYLLSLALPSPPPAPVPVPALLPRLPAHPETDSTNPLSPNVPLAGGSENVNVNSATVLNTLCMAENDIQQTARFAREFVVMSLVPWMEKCVLEWNENFSSTRRLPSRLFSSTRRLFGSPSTTPVALTPSGTPPTRTVTLPPMNGGAGGFGSVLPGGAGGNWTGGGGPPSQQRRLAEFATILGDFKLAVMVWEALRKESKGGSDILPLLLSPSPLLKQHAHASLISIHPSMTMMDLPPAAQLRAMVYAVRWEAGIKTQDLVREDVEGERWLVWAASNAEEAPSALLLAQAALLSSRKPAWRRAALWYTLAANRLEKCGIKPLTMYFLKKARELYTSQPAKELSPSFWQSEGKSSSDAEGLEDIISGLEHPLGRLLYTTGDLSGAVKLFLGLLRGSATFSTLNTLSLIADGTPRTAGSDKLYLDDFRVAFSYWKSTDPKSLASTPLELPIKLCVGKQSRPRYPGDTLSAETDMWTERQEDWSSFWKEQGGKEGVDVGGRMSVDELFWVDLTLHNPLDAEITLSDLTLFVEEVSSPPSSTSSTSSSPKPAAFVQIETLKEVLIRPKETTTLPISMKSSKPSTLCITHALYTFLGLLPIKESLSYKGARLHSTPIQRRSRTYAPDVKMQVEVVPNDWRLSVSFVEDERLVMMQGEMRNMRLWVSNNGIRDVGEVWMVVGREDEVWIGEDEGDEVGLEPSTTHMEVIKSSNTLKTSPPRRIPLGGSNLRPGEGREVPIIFHAENLGEHDLCLLFVFREDQTGQFHSTRLLRSYEVQELCETTIKSTPSQSPDHAYAVDMDITNSSTTTSINIVDVVSLSAQWSCRALFDRHSDVLTPSQSSRLVFAANPWLKGQGCQETSEFVYTKLGNFLRGGVPDHSLPPPIDLVCCHIAKNSKRSSASGAAFKDLTEMSRRNYASRHLVQNHPSIPLHFHANTFPLYHPSAVDFMIFWEDTSQNRFGHINVRGITLGAGHAALDGLIDESESAKYKRSMYAETRKENLEIVESVRNSEWNAEMNPLVLSVKDGQSKEHNFASGACQIPVEFMIRNHSLSLPARYTLKLQPDSSSRPPRDFQPPSYSGRLTFRGTIHPSQHILVYPKLWVSRPGIYSLSGWSLKTEISTQINPALDLISSTRRYIQESEPNDPTYMLVCNAKVSQ